VLCRAVPGCTYTPKHSAACAPVLSLMCTSVCGGVSACADIVVKIKSKYPIGHGELPEGWFMKVHKSGRPYFLNSITKKTTWIDPRLVQGAAWANFILLSDSKNVSVANRPGGRAAAGVGAGD
jgi:hypothetical protein